jgi:hypothetical protein
MKLNTAKNFDSTEALPDRSLSKIMHWPTCSDSTFWVKLLAYMSKFTLCFGKVNLYSKIDWIDYDEMVIVGLGDIKKIISRLLSRKLSRYSIISR